VLAGPFAGRIFESLGADVVKVEPPEGDVTRLWGDVRHGLSGYFTQQNAGKRTVCIDLQADGAADLLLELAAHADLMIENYRPGVLERLGVGWSELQRASPRIVLLSISGYGQAGPEARRAAYAPVVHAEAGLLARQAQAEHKPPRDSVLSIADMNGGMHGVIGALAALWMRERTGRGQHVDVALYDAMLFTDDYAHFALDGLKIRLASGEVWDAPAGPIMVAGDFRFVWQSLTKHCGVHDPAGSDTPLEEKIRLRREAAARFFSSFADRPALIAALDAANLAWGDVRSTAEAFESPTALAREIAPALDDRGGGTRRVVRTPYRFSDAACGTRRPAGYRGEHNAEVLREWLDADDARIAALVDRGILLGRKSASASSV